MTSRRTPPQLRNVLSPHQFLEHCRWRWCLQCPAGCSVIGAPAFVVSRVVDQVASGSPHEAVCPGADPGRFLPQLCELRVVARVALLSEIPTGPHRRLSPPPAASAFWLSTNGAPPGIASNDASAAPFSARMCCATTLSGTPFNINSTAAARIRQRPATLTFRSGCVSHQRCIVRGRLGDPAWPDRSRGFRPIQVLLHSLNLPMQGGARDAAVCQGALTKCELTYCVSQSNLRSYARPSHTMGIPRASARGNRRPVSRPSRRLALG